MTGKVLGRIAGALLALALGLGVAQGQTLLPNAEQTFVDSNGTPLANGQVFFYIPTTLTPKTTWQDSALSVPNTNPVTLDSAGRALIWGSGLYREVVKDQFGNTIWDQVTYAWPLNSSEAANTMLGNWSNSIGAPTANAMPNCPDSGANRLNYNPGTGIVCGSSGATVPLNYISKLELSTAGSSATFTTAAGVAADSTNALLMTLAAPLSKTPVSWVVGSGGCLDTGSVTINTWYHEFLIERTDLGAVDVLCSLSATSPTLPVGYTYKRRIGSMKTNGSSQWTTFTQNNGYVNYATEVNDNLNTACVAANTQYTLTVAPGVLVSPIISIRVDFSGSVTNFVIGSGGTNATWTVAAGSSGSQLSPIQSAIVTNTSGQIAINAGSTNCTLTTFTLGYYDFRGQ